jgi:hypothetical protein
MLIPHIKFIEALVLSHKTIPDILLTLNNHNLLKPSLKELELIVKTIMKLQPQVFKGEYPDFAWLQEVGLAPIWSHLNNAPLLEAPAEQMQFIKHALEIVGDPILYKVLTSIILAKGEDEQLELIVSSGINTKYSLQDFLEFQYLFFNIEDWTTKEKLQYVDDMPILDLKSVYTLALKGDVEYLLWKLGIRLSAVDYSFMLADMARDSYWHFKENAQKNPDSAQKWGTLATKLVEKANMKEKELTNGSPLDDIQFQIQARVGKHAIIESTEGGTQPPLGFIKFNELK